MSFSWCCHCIIIMIIFFCVPVKWYARIWIFRYGGNNEFCWWWVVSWGLVDTGKWNAILLMNEMCTIYQIMFGGREKCHTVYANLIFVRRSLWKNVAIEWGNVYNPKHRYLVIFQSLYWNLKKLWLNVC